MVSLEPNHTNVKVWYIDSAALNQTKITFTKYRTTLFQTKLIINCLNDLHLIN